MTGLQLVTINSKTYAGQLRQWESQEAKNKVTPNFQQILLYNTDFTVNNTIELI